MIVLDEAIILMILIMTDRNNENFQLALAYVMLSQHYGLNINVKSFREYCSMDKTEAKQFARKLVEAQHGYRDALSGFLQGNI